MLFTEVIGLRAISLVGEYDTPESSDSKVVFLLGGVNTEYCLFVDSSFLVNSLKNGDSKIISYYKLHICFKHTKIE